MAVATVLERILSDKRAELAQRQARLPAAQLAAQLPAAPALRPFLSSLRRSVQMGRAAVIAEVKKASPSKGILRPDFDPAAIARSYEHGGASCLSVLTDQPYFQGEDLYLQQARAACTLPVLRKDFIVDVYQVDEARLLGADSVLLIVAALDTATLHTCYGRALELGMDALIEVHDADELQRAVALQPAMIGINNRNLHDFSVSLDTTYDLLAAIPATTLVVSESGILAPAHIAAMRAHGVHSFLIGEAFMRAPDPGAALAALIA